MLTALCLTTALLLLAKTAEAQHPSRQNDLCVRPDGGGGCYITIQAAVDAAADGDTITIAGGTYTESVYITRTLAITGGWQPTGWPLTETVVQANGADCALSLDIVSGSLSNLTATGANTAGICGTELLTYTMANVTARNNLEQGVFAEVSRTLTITQSSFKNNGQVGLIIYCSSGNIINISVINSIFQENGGDGIAGGSACKGYFLLQNNYAVDNTESGFFLFGGICPTNKNNSPTNVSFDIINNTITGNRNGISAVCGQSTLERNFIQNNEIGIVVGQTWVTSTNNLYTDNEIYGVAIQGSVWKSANDTITNNGDYEVVLTENEVCEPPTATFYNSIVWDPVYGAFGWLEYCISHQALYYVNFSYSIVSGRDYYLSQPDPNVIVFQGGSAVYDSNPFFVGNSSYQLKPPSPAIDRGTANGAPLVDIEGQIRPLDGDGNGIPEFDMGAYEAPAGTIWRSYIPVMRGS